MDPVMQFFGQYGVLGLLAYVVIKDLGGYLIKKYLGGSASPVLPANPAAPSQHPVLDAVLTKVFGKSAPSGSNADPSFLQTLAGDIAKALAAKNPSAPAAPPPEAAK